MQFSCHPLTDWFQRAKRSFPWRADPTPYSVWVSEIMLQQTRAEVVVDYYLAWMKKFPTLQVLANSSIEEVIKGWEGLGYYSRARNLHRGAKFVVDKGAWPTTREEWERVPGVGPYTAGAILSFAFQKKAVALDANVARVASRLFYTEEQLPQKVEQILPDQNPHVAMEALIELGALICKKEPLCHQCPLQPSCQAFAHQDQKRFPTPKKRTATQHLYRYLFCITNGKELFLQKGTKGKVMADLWQFPYIEMSGQEIPSFAELQFVRYLDSEEHAFTRYRAHLFPMLFIGEKSPFPGEWVEINTVRRLPFSSGHRRVLEQFYEAYVDCLVSLGKSAG